MGGSHAIQGQTSRDQKRGGLMRWGDYIVLASLGLNLACVAAYLAQGHWRNALYFVGAALINWSIVGMR